MDNHRNHKPHGSEGLGPSETEELLDILAAMRRGDFTHRLPANTDGVAGAVAHSANALSEQLQAFAFETSRLAAALGAQGELGTQMPADGIEGTWKDLADGLNNMSLILSAQVSDVARVSSAVAEGDLSQKVTVAAGGEMAELKDSFNAMIGQLQLLKDSVNALMKRVNEMGTPSKHNGHPG